MSDDVKVDEKKIFNRRPGTWGFGINEAPIWLFKEVEKEANRWHSGTYWPVLVEWYKKAKELDNIVRGGMPAPQDEIEVEEKDENVRPTLFGKESE